MTYRKVLTALDILNEYPAIVEYIQQFNGENGFMYTIENDPKKNELKAQMENLLDDDSHSGASWGEMLRMIQAVLNGKLSRDAISQKIVNEDEYYNQWLLEKSNQIQV
jgi:hypothetical protein